MAYKFQLGSSILSGAVNVKGDLTASQDVSGALANISASNFVVAGGLQMQRVTASANFNAVGGDGIMWLNSQDGKVIAMTPTNFAATLAGDGLKATTGSVVINIDDTTINIDEDKIQVKDSGIGEDQIATAAVSYAKIQDVGANSLLIRNANSSGVLSELQLATTEIMIGDGTGMIAASLSGDVTMDNAGAVTIANNAVETVMIKNNAVTMASLATGSVETAAYATGSVTRVKIAANAVGSEQLVTGSVLRGKIAASGVGSEQLVTGSVLRAKIAASGVGSEQLVTGSVLRTKIATNAVGSEQLVAGSVFTAKIADAAVDEDKLSTDVAGQGLDGGGGAALSLDLDSISTVLTGSSLDGLDQFGVFDTGAGAQKKSTLADIATKMAGSGITATNGVLAVGTVTGSGDSITSTAVVNGDKLTAGINYFTGTIQPSLGFVVVSLPEASAPTVGDVVIVKAPSNCADVRRVSIQVSGTHKIDGVDELVLDDSYAAVSLVYVVSGSWSII